MMLYEYLHYRLVQANIRRDTEMIDEVVEHLVDLRKTWIQAIDLVRQENMLAGNVRLPDGISTRIADITRK
jgi:flagellar secretion chaperone FliS